MYVECRKNFQRESWAFQLVLWALLMILYGVLASVYSCFVVRFNIVCGAVLHGLWCALAMLRVVLGCWGWWFATGFCVLKGSYVWHRGYGAGCYGV